MLEMSIDRVRIRDSSGKEVHILTDKYVVVNFGRDKRQCHVAFDPQAARVSRVHAGVEWTDEGIILTDKSKEGTVINGTKLNQSSKELEIGIHQVQIGGIAITIEVEGVDLEETIAESPQQEVEPERVEENEEFDDVSSVSTIGFAREKTERKRKSDASIFEDSQPRGKRGPLARTQVLFDNDFENRGRKGPKTRKAVEKSIFEDENPAKKRKGTWEVEKDTRPLPSESRAPESELIESITSQVAAIPSVSQDDPETEKPMDTGALQLDRGPAAPNETIKYANLIFRAPNLKSNETSTTCDLNLPNFKRFRPKHQDGRISVASMFSATSNVTIPVVDARKIH